MSPAAPQRTALLALGNFPIMATCNTIITSPPSQSLTATDTSTSSITGTQSGITASANQTKIADAAKQAAPFADPLAFSFNSLETPFAVQPASGTALGNQGGQSGISGGGAVQASPCRRLCIPWCLYHGRQLYDLLFRAASQTLLELAADRKRLGAQMRHGHLAHHAHRHRPTHRPRGSCFGTASEASLGTDHRPEKS
jgi:hypothetical protein